MDVTMPAKPSSFTAFTSFQRLWGVDEIRDRLFAGLDKDDLLNMRQVSRDFARRTTPHAFKEMKITFRSTTFTKPARLAALARVGAYVRRLTFAMPYGLDALLPPLLEPTTGAEVEFLYTPDCDVRRPELSHHRLIGRDPASRELSDLLIKQYPPLYHAAVNVPSFIAAFSCLPNVKYLLVSTPTEDSTVPSSQSIVDYALISLRIAVERGPLTKLDHLTLSPIQPHVVKLLNPVFGPGARPNSLRRWRQIRKLTMRMPLTTAATQLKQLHGYLNALSPNLQSFVFHWLPAVARPPTSSSSSSPSRNGGKLKRPTSTDTSYFPAEPIPEPYHRGANPLTLHISSFLASRAPRQKPSAHSLPSMTSASTLNSLASSQGSSRSSPSCSPSRPPLSTRHRQDRPKLRCEPSLQRPSSSGSSSSSASSSSSSPSSPVSPSTGMRALKFPKLAFFELDSISCAASEIAAFIGGHVRHLTEFRLEHTTLEPGGGDWDDALAPLTKLTRGDTRWKDQASSRSPRKDKGEATNKTQPSTSSSSSSTTTDPQTPPRPISISRKPVPMRPLSRPTFSSLDDAEEVPIFLGPELSSPVDLSPVRIAGVDDIAAEIGLDMSFGLDGDGSGPVAELLPQEMIESEQFNHHRQNHYNYYRHQQQQQQYSRHRHHHDAGEAIVLAAKDVPRPLHPAASPCLSLSLGLPGVEPSPMLGPKRRKSSSSSSSGEKDESGRVLDRTAAAAAAVRQGCVAAGISLTKDAEAARKLVATQKALEDGVRKLLAQTVFPYF